MNKDAAVRSGQAAPLIMETRCQFTPLVQANYPRDVTAYNKQSELIRVNSLIHLIFDILISTINFLCLKDKQYLTLACYIQRY